MILAYLGLALWCGTAGLITLVIRGGRSGEADRIAETWEQSRARRLYRAAPSEAFAYRQAAQRNCVRGQIEDVLEKAGF